MTNQGVLPTRLPSGLARLPWWSWYLVLFGALAGAHFAGFISTEVAVWFSVLMPSMVLHEVSHGAVANHFGDDTALRAGRLTLNPLAHISPFSTIILPILCYLTVGVPFGSAKPVPVNVSRLREPRNQSVFVSLAGPLVNLTLVALAFVAGWVTRVHTLALNISQFSAQPTWMMVVFEVGLLNLVLAAFNLLPIPPLDGSAVIERMLPERMLPKYFAVRSLSFPLLLILVVSGNHLLNWPFDHLFTWWGKVFYG